MSFIDAGIEYRQVEESLAATQQIHLRKREDIVTLLAQLKARIPAEIIAGPPFSIVNFISGVKEGMVIDIGYPVMTSFETDDITTHRLPELEVLALTHQGPFKKVGESYGILYGAARPHAIISDEFAREVYLDINDPENWRVEIQFVIHNWNTLLSQNVLRVLGEDARQQVMLGVGDLDLEATSGQRNTWTQGAIERLDELADENQRYEILSRCAHVFPKEHIERLRAVYQEDFAQNGDLYQAVDAVIEFIHQDPVWGVEPSRQGKTIFVAKRPRDRQAYTQATTDAERRQAYCFCPLIRDHLEDGISDTFCYCSAGWERQQWEGATGLSLQVDVVESLVRGDEHCQFAIHLP